MRKAFYLFHLVFCVSFLFIQGCAPTKLTKTVKELSLISDSSDVAEMFKTSTDWIETQLEKMTLEEKVAQMITVRAYGYFMNDENEKFRQLVHQVRDGKVGGVCVFQGDIHTTAILINRLQAIAKVPLLIASDFEWGAAMRLRRTTRFPEAMALGATRDTLLAFNMGKAIAEEARAIGIHQVYAPVADVNVNPNNPVINTRSFGESPMLVAEMAIAMTRGLQSGGVIATAKHFPGHGDTDIDSHLGLPQISYDRARLDSVELFPFKKLIEHGIASVMIGHVTVPVLQRGNQSLPATLSVSVIDKLLKKELGFDGLVVTDALEMRAVTNMFGADSAAVLAVEAGNDILLLSPDDVQAIETIVERVRRGQILEERINNSVKKILALKQWSGLNENTIVDVEKISLVVSSPEKTAGAKDVARASITLLQKSNVLPLSQDDRKRYLNIIIGDLDDYRTEVHRQDAASPSERIGDYFTSQIRLKQRNLQTLRLTPSSNSMAIDSIVIEAASAEVIMAPIYSKVRSASNKLGLPQNIVDALNRVLMLNKPVVLISFGSPYVLQSFPNAAAYLFAYSDAECSIEAAAEVIFGEISTSGRLPITIPGLFNYGDGIMAKQTILRRDLPESIGFNHDSLAVVDSIVNRAISNSAFPGAQIAVVKNGVLVLDKSFGNQSYNSSDRHIGNETMFDIASLTKVVATTPAIMKLYEEQQLHIDDPVVKFIPEFGNHNKENITIRNLLVHNAGLPAFKRLFLTCKTPEEVLDSVYQTEMIYPAGDSTVYSDFDFILLGKIIERITGVTLDMYADSVFFKPLGMTSTMFMPPSSIWKDIAPTEYDSLYRKQLIQGEVHDENAYALGGVSGHAGLFSTASDLAVFIQMIVNGGHYGGKQFLKPETIQLFTTRQSNKSTRALGWDTKTVGGYSSAGTFFGPKSFGHTGFTGTSVWVEPEKNIFVILLTNRVYPTRNNSKIMQIRPKVHDTVIKAIY